MATTKPKKQAPVRMVRRTIPADALVWRPSQPLNDQLNRIVDERANVATEQALEVLEKERIRGLMGGWTGNISDFMYSLIGYLTTRKRTLLFGAKHGCASIAELMKEIAAANELPPTSPNEGWPKLKVTEDMEGYTNDPELSSKKVAAPPPTPDQALSQLMGVIRSMNPKDHDAVLCAFLDHLKKDRQAQLNHMNQVRTLCDADHQKAQDAYYNLEKIVRGDYLTLPVYPVTLKEEANG